MKAQEGEGCKRHKKANADTRRGQRKHRRRKTVHTNEDVSSRRYKQKRYKRKVKGWTRFVKKVLTGAFRGASRRRRKNAKIQKGTSGQQ